MKISVLIEELLKIKEQNGDLDVYYSNTASENPYSVLELSKVEVSKFQNGEKLITLE